MLKEKSIKITLATKTGDEVTADEEVTSQHRKYRSRGAKG